jgi:hypothetical protein
MKLINTEQARVVRLVPLEDIRPQGGTHITTALRKVTERYEFVYSPDLRRPWEDIEKEGFKFRVGKMIHGNNEVSVGEFALYSDGLVVTTFTTDEGELFLTDLTAWAKKELGFRDLNPARVRTLYLSNVIVEFESSPNSLVNKFSLLSETLTTVLQKTYGIETPVQLSQFGMNIDRTSSVVPNIGHFSLERRVNQPYSTNRFFSSAPLKTKDHLAFLETMESTL